MGFQPFIFRNHHHHHHHHRAGTKPLLYHISTTTTIIQPKSRHSKRFILTVVLSDEHNDSMSTDSSIIPLSSNSSTTSITTTSTTSKSTSTNSGLNLLGTASSIVPQGIIVIIVSTIWNFIWKILMTELAPQSKDGAYIRPTYLTSSFTSSCSSSNTTTTSLLLSPLNSSTNDTTTSISSSLQQSPLPRYHIYVGNPCPWCHRVALTMNVLQLTNDFQIHSLIDNPKKASRGGWILNLTTTNTDNTGTSHDENNWKDLRDVYNYYYTTTSSNNDTRTNKEYIGRCTAPLLVDTYTKMIISNESADIVQLLIQYYETYKRSSSILQPTVTEGEESLCYNNLYPIELRDNIDNTTQWIYETLNNGVYRCGFATSQNAYNVACNNVRNGLEECNHILSSSTFLCSNTTFTIADIYLLPTLLRYDGVYSPLFRAGGSHISLQNSKQYKHIYRYIYHCWNTIPGIRTSINITQACTSYYEQLFPLNPSQIKPYPITAHDLGLE